MRQRATFPLRGTKTEESQSVRASTQRAYGELKRRILTCRLAPGTPLPERSLGKELGIARMVFHQVCLRLAQDELVRPGTSKTFFVAPFTLADIRELCELRRIVEGQSAALAAERSEPSGVARLLAVAELRYQPGERHTYESYLRTNTAFHRRLALAAQNPRLEAAVTSVIGHIQRPLYLGLDFGLDPEEATAEHLMIVDAVRRRRQSLAAQLMESQIRSAEKRMIEALGDSGFA
jgi:DNA-binding GntR family transcriptional regulator